MIPEAFVGHYVHVFVLILLVVGLYGMLAKRNLAKKVIGLVIFQTAMFLFFIEGSLKMDATVPIIDPDVGTNPADYMNPLPHLLILTAIVVGVAVAGVAMAFLVQMYRRYGTLEEDSILEQIED